IIVCHSVTVMIEQLVTVNSSDIADKPRTRKRVELTNAEELYAVRDRSGEALDIETVDGDQLFNHYRHRMTNYDEVLDDIRERHGNITKQEAKKVTAEAAARVLEVYRDEHVKVVKDSQKKGNILKKLMGKAGVGTASALSSWLDGVSDKLKDIASLESSRRQLQVWNDTYRVQKVLVKEILKLDGVPEQTIEKVNVIYGTRSTRKAIERGTDLLELEKEKIAAMVKSSVRYTMLG
ncbi:MAG: hypothetical protein AAGM36_15470, partial [Cyanobacteria bacterium J06597_1]